MRIRIEAPSRRGHLDPFTLVRGLLALRGGLEESAMLAQFGVQYETYRTRVKGLVPSVW